MTLVKIARDLIRYTGARQPMLLVSKDRLDDWLTETCDCNPPLIDKDRRFDGIPFRCVSMQDALHIVDMAP